VKREVIEVASRFLGMTFWGRKFLNTRQLSRQLGGFMDQDRQMLRANPESLILVL
jgi:hypothetical protein